MDLPIIQCSTVQNHQFAIPKLPTKVQRSHPSSTGNLLIAEEAIPTHLKFPVFENLLIVDLFEILMIARIHPITVQMKLAGCVAFRCFSCNQTFEFHLRVFSDIMSFRRLKRFSSSLQCLGSCVRAHAYRLSLILILSLEVVHQNCTQNQDIPMYQQMC